MEAAVYSEVPTYAGGLGVLVGDKLRAARDFRKKLEVVTFSYPRGYVKNRIDGGKVVPEDNPYDPESRFRVYDERTVQTKWGDVPIKILRDGPVWFIHTDVAPRLYVENSPIDRLKKEILLGDVSKQLLFEEDFDILHVEESHGAFATIGVGKKIVFTTHTPLPHGHERWDKDSIKNLYSDMGEVNMTKLALRAADYVNCVSKMHKAVMNRHLGGRADYITNGVYKGWMHPAIQKAVSKSWSADSTDDSRLEWARMKTKKELVDEVNSWAIREQDFDEEAFTVGIARRFTSYKRMDLLLDEFGALDRFAAKTPIQIVFSGIAHPHDVEGIKTIEGVLQMSKAARHLKIAYFPVYSMELARKMAAGCDIWLNVPEERQEASGTSWMKAMMNGTLLISTASGSVPEFAVHGKNSMILSKGIRAQQAKELLRSIKTATGKDLTDISKNAIAAAKGFTAERMLKEYYAKAYQIPT